MGHPIAEAEEEDVTILFDITTLYIGYEGRYGDPRRCVKSYIESYEIRYSDPRRYLDPYIGSFWERYDDLRRYLNSSEATMNMRQSSSISRLLYQNLRRRMWRSAAFLVVMSTVISETTKKKNIPENVSILVNRPTLRNKTIEKMSVWNFFITNLVRFS